MHRALLAFVVFVCAACGENQTLVDREGYVAPEPEPLACVPNLDGAIDAGELDVAIDVPVRYLVSPAGGEREVDIAGSSDETGPVWDWSIDRADDQEVVVTAERIEGRWYESSFSPEAFVTPFDAAHRLETIARLDGEALWVLGIASAEPDPAEGRTLLVYDEPVATLRFPIEPGLGFTSTGVVSGGELRGLPYAGTDVYEVAVDASGRLELPQLVFTQVHRVRTLVTATPAVGAAVSTRQVSFYFECFGEVARALSRPDEPNPDFTTAAEVWRLGFR